MRLNLTEKETQDLLKSLEFSNNQELQNIYKKLQNQYDNNVKRDIQKKQKAVKKATQKRSNIAKKKIEYAINLLRLEQKNITVYSVSQVSKVSYNTVKKYQDFILKQNTLF